MKRIFILIFVAILAIFASCSKEIEVKKVDSAPQTIVCGIDEATTKTNLNGVATTWSEGDKIIIVDNIKFTTADDSAARAAKAFKVYKIKSGVGSSSALFEVDNSYASTQTLTGKVCAIYPGKYGWGSKQWNAMYYSATDADKLCFQNADAYIMSPISKTQEYIPTVDGTVKLDMPMYACASSVNNLTFSPMYSILRFNIAATSEIKVTKAVLTANSTARMSGCLYYWRPGLPGTGTETFGGAPGYMDPYYSYKNDVVISFANGAGVVVNSGSSIIVNAIVYPSNADYSSFQIDIYTEASGEETPAKTVTLNTAPKALKPEAGKIHNLGTITMPSSI